MLRISFSNLHHVVAEVELQNLSPRVKGLGLSC